jgi:hypothetical protein
MIEIIRNTLSFLLFVSIFYSSNAQQTTNPWSKWDYLLGEWIGDGKGEPGEGKGSFTLTSDLDKNVLVRINHTEYQPTKDRPALNHEDIMIVYSGNTGASAKAIYFDNEKHVINYIISYSDDGNDIILTSEAIEGTPRFRFTYKRIDANKIKTIFEIAPPGNPDAFNVYLEGTAHRKN